MGNHTNELDAKHLGRRSFLKAGVATAVAKVQARIDELEAEVKRLGGE